VAAALLFATGYVLFAGDGREDVTGAVAGASQSVECTGEGHWQAYVAIEVAAGQTGGAVAVEVQGADRASVTDVIIDNGYVTGTPPRIGPGVADVLLKDGGIATNDPIMAELTARRGDSAVSNFRSDVRFSGNIIGVKAFREAPTKAAKNVAVTLTGNCN
jgi:hypothetical protein